MPVEAEDSFITVDGAKYTEITIQPRRRSASHLNLQNFVLRAVAAQFDLCSNSSQEQSSQGVLYFKMKTLGTATMSRPLMGKYLATVGFNSVYTAPNHNNTRLKALYIVRQTLQ